MRSEVGDIAFAIPHRWMSTSFPRAKCRCIARGLIDSSIQIYSFNYRVFSLKDFIEQEDDCER
jgi:hypothetical protein